MALDDFFKSIADEELLGYQIGPDPLISYIAAMLIFLLSIVVLKIFKQILIGRIKEFAKKTKTDLDDLAIRLVEKIGWPFYVSISVYLAFQLLLLDGIIRIAINAVLFIVIGYYLIRSAGRIIDFGAKRMVEERKDQAEKVDPGVVHMLATISKLALWSVVVLLIISNLGYDTSALLTGLGIGGIAVALALQTVLSDVFAYFSIHLDKPFSVGDFIVLGADMGTVEKIGIKSTRIRTLQGPELVISNQELTSSRINNYKKMQKRRIVFGFTISSEIPSTKIRKIPQMVKKIIEDMELAEFDRAHFQKFGDYGLIFEIVYYITSPEYNKFMDVQQEINLSIKEQLEKEGIEMPYPTQTVYLNKRS